MLEVIFFAAKEEGTCFWKYIAAIQAPLKVRRNRRGELVKNYRLVQLLLICAKEARVLEKELSNLIIGARYLITKIRYRLFMHLVGKNNIYRNEFLKQNIFTLRNVVIKPPNFPS